MKNTNILTPFIDFFCVPFSVQEDLPQRRGYHQPRGYWYWSSRTEPVSPSLPTPAEIDFKQNLESSEKVNTFLKECGNHLRKMAGNSVSVPVPSTLSESHLQEAIRQLSQVGWVVALENKSLNISKPSKTV